MPVDNSNTNKFCRENCIERITNGILLCRCGEDRNHFEWKFQRPESALNVVLSNNDKDVLFHPERSEGTAVVKGGKPFERDKHYYWEVKIVSPLYGSDVMVGIGTGRINYQNLMGNFCSFLGLDAESWGYSYRGTVQHDQEKRDYGISFGIGCLVGVYLDMWKGSLEYYVNRRPRGVAFENLRKHSTLYPMLSSTAAESLIRLTCSASASASLQLHCLKVVMKHPHLYRTYRNELPQIAEHFESKYFWLQPSNEGNNEAVTSEEVEKD